jgi:iron(III) transport system ATP-binding protein
MAEAVLEFRDVTKRFGAVSALDGVNFTIRPGEFFTLLGPSGCGKTTTLRLVAGLEEPDRGEILVNHVSVAAPSRGIFIGPDKRQLGMVFQSYAIWPHLTVFENVAFPLRVRGTSHSVVKAHVRQALEIVGLGGLEGRSATELSGGQQQRVALARALVYAPSILLLDEPLSNLDAKLREQMRLEIRALQKKLKLTVLYVTHDQAEAMTLSDRIAVVNRGRFEQLGTPPELYERPATPFVTDFLGRTIVFEGTVVSRDGASWFELENSAGTLWLRGNDDAHEKQARLAVRPEDIEIVPSGKPARNEINAKIQEVAYLGDHFEYHVNAGGKTFTLSGPKKDSYSVGSDVRLRFDPGRIHIQFLTF